MGGRGREGEEEGDAGTSCIHNHILSFYIEKEETLCGTTQIQGTRRIAGMYILCKWIHEHWLSWRYALLFACCK